LIRHRVDSHACDIEIQSSAYGPITLRYGAMQAPAGTLRFSIGSIAKLHFAGPAHLAIIRLAVAAAGNGRKHPPQGE
jgi:hypothetical protein